MELTAEIREELLAFAEANPGKVAVTVYPDTTTDDGWDYMPFNNVATAYEQREEMYDEGNPLWPEGSILVINLWKLEEQNK